MKLKFFGSPAMLGNIVRECGSFGYWRFLGRARCHQFRSTEDEILNWWPSTGTMSFQGQPGALQPRLIKMFAQPLANDDRDGLVSQRPIIR